MSRMVPAAAVLCALLACCTTPCEVKVYEFADNPGFYFFEYDSALHSSVPTTISPLCGYPEMIGLIVDSNDLRPVDFLVEKVVVGVADGMDALHFGVEEVAEGVEVFPGGGGDVDGVVEF